MLCAAVGTGPIRSLGTHGTAHVFGWGVPFVLSKAITTRYREEFTMRYFAVAVVVLSLVTGARADSAKIVKHVKAVPQRYIVVLNDAAVPKHNVSAVAHELVSRFGGRIPANPQGEEIFDSALRGFVVLISDQAAGFLSDDPRVKFLEEDAYTQMSATRDFSIEMSYPVYDYRRWNLDRVDEFQSVFDPAKTPTDSAVYRGGKSYNYSTTGSGVFIYLMDTGLERTHQEFSGGRVMDGANFTDDGNTAYSTCSGVAKFDTDTPATHGQGTASIAGGNTVGVANGAYIVPLKVMSCDSQGRSLLSWWVSAMNWIIGANPNRYKPSTYPLVQWPAVVSISMFYDAALFPGSWKDVSLDSFETAVTNVIAAGIPVVASANNQGPDYVMGSSYQSTYLYGRSCYQSPARLAYHARDGVCDSTGCSGNYFVGDPAYRVIVVGGTDEYDRIWNCNDWSGECAANTTGSNTGRCVDIYAPAHRVKVANLEGSTTYRTSIFSGTSFSAPYVAGIAARLLQANPSWTPYQVWTQIHDIAQHLSNNFDHDDVPDNDRLAHLDSSN
jgi:serine protease